MAKESAMHSELLQNFAENPDANQTGTATSFLKSRSADLLSVSLE